MSSIQFAEEQGGAANVSDVSDDEWLDQWAGLGRRKLMSNSEPHRFKRILTCLLTGGPEKTSENHNRTQTILAGVMSHAFVKQPRSWTKFAKPKRSNLVVLYNGLKRLRDTWSKSIVVEDSRIHYSVSYQKLLKATNNIVQYSKNLLDNFDAVSMPANCIEGEYDDLHYVVASGFLASPFPS